LCLVKNNDTAGNVVKLSAPRRSSGKEALEELDIRCHHDGRGPVFHRQFELVPLFSLLSVSELVLFNGGVVFQYLLGVQHGSKDVGCLIDDGRERNGVDDPSKAMVSGVVQGKRERR
jgi:hypothetical protein